VREKATLGLRPKKTLVGKGEKRRKGGREQLLILVPWTWGGEKGVHAMGLSKTGLRNARRAENNGKDGSWAFSKMVRHGRPRIWKSRKAGLEKKHQSGKACNGGVSTE